MMDKQRGDRARLTGEAGFGLVEALVAVVVFAVGMLAVAGVALQVGQLATLTTVASDQTMAAEQTFDALREGDFDVMGSGTGALQVGNQTYSIERDVTQLSSDTKEVVAVVSGVDPIRPDTFRTVLHRPTGYPAGP